MAGFLMIAAYCNVLGCVQIVGTKLDDSAKECRHRYQEIRRSMDKTLAGAFPAEIRKLGEKWTVQCVKRDEMPVLPKATPENEIKAAPEAKSF